MLHWAFVQPVSCCTSTRACALSGHIPRNGHLVFRSPILLGNVTVPKIFVSIYTPVRLLLAPQPWQHLVPSGLKYFANPVSVTYFIVFLFALPWLLIKLSVFFLWTIINYFCFLFCKSASSCHLLICLLGYLFFQSNWFIGIL